MLRRLGFALVLCALIVPAAAGAEVTILDSDANEVDSVGKGKCKLVGGKGDQDFSARAKSKSGEFTLSVRIDASVFRGFNSTYIVYFGDDDLYTALTDSGGEIFSNFNIPGTPAGTVGGGVVKFDNGRRKVGVGLSPAFNRSRTKSYSFAGFFRCKYPKPKKRAVRPSPTDSSGPKWRHQ